MDGRTVGDLKAEWQTKRLVMLRAMRANQRTALRAPVRLCGLYPRIDLEGEPTLLLTRVRGRDGVTRNLVSIGGLHRCGSVWTCPWCAFVSAIKRRAQLEELTEGWVEQAGGSAAFLTLTMRHRGGEALADLWDCLRDAWSAVRVARVWKALQRLGMHGWLRVTEVTFSAPADGGHGWHVHLHALLFLEEPLLTDEALSGRPIIEGRRARRAAEGVTLEAVRHRIFSAWSSKLAAMGREAPAERRRRRGPGGEFVYPAVDLRPVESTARLRWYFDKQGLLDPTWTIAREFSDGATAKSARENQERKGSTPLELLRAFSEDRDPAAAAWFFNLPNSRTDESGRRADRRTWFSVADGGVFELHAGTEHPGWTEELEGVRVEHDSRTGEVGRLLVDVPEAHRAWFEFQASSRTVPADEDHGPGTRSQTYRQVRKVKAGVAAGDRRRTAWLGLLPTLDEQDEGEDDGHDTDAAAVGLGGTEIGGFTRQGWDRYHYGLSVEEQAWLHDAFEISAEAGLRRADRLGVEVRLKPADDVGRAYGAEPS